MRRIFKVTNVLLSGFRGAEMMMTFETILLAFSGEIASQGGLTTESKQASGNRGL